MVKDDFLISVRFVAKERADIMKRLLLAALYLVLIPTGIVVGMIGVASVRFFRGLDV